jgi:shikimate dehydrogenase
VVGSEPGIDVAASLYTAGFEAAGLETSCETLDIEADRLTALVGRMRRTPGLVGAAITMPHTVPITTLLDELAPEAQTTKAVNTISRRAGRVIGWNTNCSGFSQALVDAGYQPKGRTALVLGAGGSARACVDILRKTASRVWVTSPDLDEARGLCRDLQVTAGGPTPIGSLALVARKVDLIVNATPVGNDGEGQLLPVEWISPAQFVFDLIYQPPVTPLVRGARERGARAVNGLSMLLFQALAAFEIWTGQAAPETAMRAALERAVLGRLSAT